MNLLDAVGDNEEPKDPDDQQGPTAPQARVMIENTRPARIAMIAVIVVVAAVVSIIGVFALLMRFEVGSRIAPGMTRDAFVQLRPGMDEQRVLAAIGAPLWEHHYHGEGVGSQLAHDATETVWQYAAPGFIDSGFAVYVTFNDHVVKATEIKHNDFTIYACTAWKCPNMIGDERVLARLSPRRN